MNTATEGVAKGTATETGRDREYGIHANVHQAMRSNGTRVEDLPWLGEYVSTTLNDGADLDAGRRLEVGGKMASVEDTSRSDQRLQDDNDTAIC